MNTAAKMIVTGVSTVALACGIGAGLAYADPPNPTPTPTASASPTTPTAKPSNPDKRQGPRIRRFARLAARALHGEVTLAGKEHRVVVFQRGPVQKVSDTSLTVRSSDGYTATYAVSADTVVRKDGDKATIAEVKSGEEVIVVADKDGSTLKALRIRVKN